MNPVAEGASVANADVTVVVSVTSRRLDRARPGGRRTRGEISARELLDLHLARIAERNPQLNAIVSLDEDRARQGAADADQAWRAAPRSARCTGCRSRSRTPTRWPAGARRRLAAVRRPRARARRADRRAGPAGRGGGDRQDQRARVRGGLAHVQQGLRHDAQPGRPSRSAGGSSGGAACALAAGWCAGRGLGHGRVAAQPGEVLRRGRAAADARAGCRTGRPDNYWEQPLSTGGPMARNVGDLALLLSVIAGPDRNTPFALSDPGARFGPAGERHAGRAAGRPVRRPGRRDRGRRRGRRRGGPHRPRPSPPPAPRWRRPRPTCRFADDVFRTLRAWQFQAAFADELAQHPDAFKPSLADNIRAGEEVSGADVARAYAQRTTVMGADARVPHDLRRAGAADLEVPPFPADQEYPADDQRAGPGDVPGLDAPGYLITVSGCPAISVPAAPPPTVCRSGSSSWPRTAPTGSARGRRRIRGRAGRETRSEGGRAVRQHGRAGVRRRLRPTP